MAIYAYSPELRLEFRRQHRRKVVRLRAQNRHRREAKPRDSKNIDRDFLNAIDRDENGDERLERSENKE